MINLLGIPDYCRGTSREFQLTEKLTISPGILMYVDANRGHSFNTYQKFLKH